MSARPASRRQGGVALITVLLIIAILTAVVTRLAFSNQMWIRQVENNTGQTQASLGLRAAQQWVGLLLEKDNNGFDAVTDIWGQQLPPVPLDGGTLHGWMEDMQARFNLNNLVNADGKVNNQALVTFTRLLRILDLNPGIAQAVVDWIDPDSTQTGAWGAEDYYYNQLQPSYNCANQPFASAEELRLVRGVNDEAWRRLQAQVTALPRYTDININTASPEVLAALVREWGPPVSALGHARSWAAAARTRPASTIAEFTQRALTGEQQPQLESAGVKSDFFRAHMRLEYREFEQQMATLFYRAGNGYTYVLGQYQEFDSHVPR